MSFGFGFGLPHPRFTGGGLVGGYLSFVYSATDTSIFPYTGSVSVVNADKTITEFGVFNDINSSLYYPVVNKLSTTGVLTSQLAEDTGDANFSNNGAGTIYAMSLAQDSSGNIYVVAWFQSPKAYKLLKFNSSGVYQNGLSLNSFTGSVTPYSGVPKIAIDASNNILIVGGALSSGAMIPLITVSTALSVTSWQYCNNYSITIANSDSASAYIAPNIQSAAGVVIGFAKYNAVAAATTSYVQSKTNAWTKSIISYNTSLYPYTDIFVVNADSSGNVYAATRTGDGGTSGYITLMKFSSSGTLLWQRQTVSGAGTFNPVSICFDSSDNVYLISSEYDTYQDYTAIYRYTPSGTLYFSRQLYSQYGSEGIYPNSAVISNNDPNYIYITGTVYDSVSGGVWSQVFKIPTNGSGTGTYPLYGYSWVYALGPTDGAGVNVINAATNAAYTTTTGTSSAYSQTFSTTTALTNSVVQI